MEYLDLDSTKLAEGAVHLLERAEDEARRRHYDVLTSEHLFVAFARVEWALYARVMRDLSLNPDDLLRAVESLIAPHAEVVVHTIRLSQEAQDSLHLAVAEAARQGRHAAEAYDVFAAVFEDRRGGPALMIQRFGADPGAVVARLLTVVHDVELRDDRLRKKYELPPFLRQFATNLNLLARQDKLPPVFGRDAELQQVIEILCHRERANSVMLIGEPGVGKTAIADALARRLELEPDLVPMQLRDCQVLSLPMNALVAGTMLRGMFEDRIQNVLREVREQPHYLLFIDEAHTMIGAGSALGAPSDAGNVFKAALARGEVRIIGATTLAEYKQHVAEDEALARRFRTVTIDEPTPEEARDILSRLAPRFEQNYSVRILDSAIDEALTLADRYQRHLRLPDKAIGWLDTAAVRAELAGRSEIDAADVRAVVAGAARIPLDMVRRDVGTRFKGLEERLGARVVGQQEAVAALARRIVLNKGPLKDGFSRPDAVLLFLGPTGVGKTELAKALAACLFGDEKRMIRIDMSEFQDGPAAVDKLIGAPRGIVGSDRGGILTNQVRDNPYSVVLLDEVEKASPELLNLFLQAFDEGWMTDGRGRRVYFSDAVIIMTSNVGAEHFRKLVSPLGFRQADGAADAARADVVRELERRFSPEFRNRIDDVVVFSPLSRDDVRAIARTHLDRLAATMESHGKTLSVDADALDVLVEEGYNPASGARYLKRVLDDRVKIPISQQWNDGSEFHVTCADGRLEVLTVDAHRAEPAAVG